MLKLLFPRLLLKAYFFLKGPRCSDCTYCMCLHLVIHFQRIGLLRELVELILKSTDRQIKLGHRTFILTVNTFSKFLESVDFDLDAWLSKRVVVLDSVEQFGGAPERVRLDHVERLLGQLRQVNVLYLNV